MTVKTKEIFLVILIGFLATLFFTADTWKNLGELNYKLKNVLSWGYDAPQFIQQAKVASEKIMRLEKFYPIVFFQSSITYLLSTGILISLGINNIMAHNIFFIFILFLIFLSYYVFLKSLNYSIGLSLLGAVIFFSCNYIHFEFAIGHMNYVQVQWLPLLFLLTKKIYETTNKKTIWGLFILVLVMQFFSAGQYMLFASILIPVYLTLLILFDFKKENKNIKKTIFFVVSGFIVVGFAVSFWLIESTKGSTQIFSLGLCQSSMFTLSNFFELIDKNNQQCYLGLIVFTLFIIAGIEIIIKKIKNQYVNVIMAIFTILLCIPPYPGTPYFFLYHFWPGMKHVRVPERFFPFAFIFFVLVVIDFINRRTEKLDNKKKIVVYGIILFFMTFFDWIPSPWIGI